MATIFRSHEQHHVLHELPGTEGMNAEEETLLATLASLRTYHSAPCYVTPLDNGYSQCSDHQGMKGVRRPFAPPRAERNTFTPDLT